MVSVPESAESGFMDFPRTHQHTECGAEWSDYMLQLVESRIKVGRTYRLHMTYRVFSNHGPKIIAYCS